MKGLLTVVSLAALLAAAPAWANTAAHANARSLSTPDRTFVKKAGDGNLAEAQLGKLAERKAATPAVKEFGRWMATDHALANKRLNAIAQKMGKADNFHPRLTQQDISLKNKLQGLSGQQFDTQYMQAMVRDHQKDIKAFEKEAQEGQNKEIKMYARNMLPVLKQHLAEAEQLAGGNRLAVGAGGRTTTGSGSSIQHYNR